MIIISGDKDGMVDASMGEVDLPIFSRMFINRLRRGSWIWYDFFLFLQHFKQ